MSRKLWIVARQGLADLSQPVDADLLLLEGSWESEDLGEQTLSIAPTGRRFALDTLVDSRWGWIDEEAARLADQAIGSLPGDSADGEKAADAPDSFPDYGKRLRLRSEWIDALALRYAMVRWLRAAAFFRRILPLQPGQLLEAFLAPGRDEDYAILLEQLAHKTEAYLTVQWCSDGWHEPAWLAPNPWWRRWLGRLARWGNPPLPGSGQEGVAWGRPCVLLCGNPRILDPVCQALLDRQVQVWQLYERFAIRAWLQWRRFGVGQLWCDLVPADAVPSPSSRHPTETNRGLFSVNRLGGKNAQQAYGRDQPAVDRLLPCGIVRLDWEGIDLAPAAQWWVSRRLLSTRCRYHQWIVAVEGHLARLRPQAVILDEDATPFARVVTAAARVQGIPCWVVQHGAPYIRFGFAPLEADAICVWDQPSFQQLVRWGVPAERILITGSPWQEKLCAEVQRLKAHIARTGKERNGFRSGAAAKEKPFQVLLLTTTPPRDHRPDAVCFHLTTASYGAMIRWAFAAAARLPGVRLIVRLHPRTGRDPWVEKARQEFPQLSVRQAKGASLAECLLEADCVLSCASSAGVDAVRAGWPVIQLLPEGSDELLPAEQWGFVGTARTEPEIYELLCRVRSGDWAPAPPPQNQPPGGIEPSLPRHPLSSASRCSPSARAADRIAELILAGIERRPNLPERKPSPSFAAQTPPWPHLAYPQNLSVRSTPVSHSASFDDQDPQGPRLR